MTTICGQVENGAPWLSGVPSRFPKKPTASLFLLILRALFLLEGDNSDYSLYTVQQKSKKVAKNHGIVGTRTPISPS